MQQSVELKSNPAWACPSPCAQDGPPSDFNAFVNFASAAVQHYASLVRVSMVEIYNEPDSWSTWGNIPAQYAQLLCSTYSRVHMVQPSVPVIMGGLAYDAWGTAPNGFSQYFFTNLAPQLKALDPSTGCTDAINFHHYTPSPTWETGGISSAISSLRRTMDKNAMSQPIVQTEGGAASANLCGWQGTPTKQAAFAAKVFPWMMSQNVRSMDWFPFHDVPNSDLGCYGSHGLENADTSHKPSLASYQGSTRLLGDPNTAFLHALASTNFTGPIGAGEGYSFNRQHPGDVNHGLITAWNNNPGTSVTLLLTPQPSLVTDQYDNTLCYPCSTSIPLPIDGTVIYAYALGVY